MTYFYGTWYVASEREIENLSKLLRKFFFYFCFGEYSRIQGVNISASWLLFSVG